MLYFLLISLSLQLTLKEQTQQFCQGIDQIELQSQLSNSNSNVRPITKKIFENQGSLSSDDYSRLDQYTIPWLLMAIISFFIYISLFSLCCFDQKCPPFKQCRRDYKYNQYRRSEILIPSTIAVVFNAITLIASIVGLATVDLKSGFLYSRCQLISSFNTFVEGNQDFAGLNALSQDLELVVSRYSYFQDQLTSTFQSRKSLSLTSQYQEILSINDNSQRGLSSSTLPIMIISDGQNLVTARESYLSSKYIFDFILAYKNDSNYNFIYAQYQTLDQSKYSLTLYPQPDKIISYYSNILSIIAALESDSNPLRNKNFAQNLEAGRLSTLSLIEAVTNSGGQIYDALSNVDTTFIQLQDYYTALLIIVLIFSVFASLSIFLVLFKKYFIMRGILHLSWNVQKIMCILTFIALIFLHPVTVIFGDSCDYFTSYLSDVTFFQNSEFISNTQTQQLFYSCLYGNGNFYSQINLYANSNQITTFMNQINNYQNQQTTIESSRIAYLNQISQNQQELQKLYDSTIIDLEPDNQFYQTINSFNQQKSNVGCVELAFTTCSDGTLPTTISSTSPTLCWHPSYFLVKSGSCLLQDSDFKILKQHFQAQAQAWAASQQREYQIKEKNSQLDYNFQTYQTEINSFISEQQKILTAFNEMSYEMNCKAIKTIFENAKNGICKHVTYNTYQGLIIVLIISFCLFFGSIFNSISGLRFYREYRYGEYGSTKVYHFKDSADTNELAAMKVDMKAD